MPSPEGLRPPVDLPGGEGTPSPASPLTLHSGDAPRSLRQTSIRSRLCAPAFEDGSALPHASPLPLDMGTDGACRTPLLASPSSPLEGGTARRDRLSARDVWPSLPSAQSSPCRVPENVGGAPRARSECVSSLLVHPGASSAGCLPAPPGRAASFPAADVLSPRGPFFLVENDSPPKSFSCDPVFCRPHPPRKLREAPEESLHFAASFDCASDAGHYGLEADDLSAAAGLCAASAFRIPLPFASASRRLSHPPDRLDARPRGLLLPSSRPGSVDSPEERGQELPGGCCLSGRERRERSDLCFASRHAWAPEASQAPEMQDPLANPERYVREGSRRNVQAFLGSSGAYNVLHKWRYTHGYLDFILNDRFHAILSMKWAHLVFLVFAVVVAWAAFLALILAVLTGGELQRCLGQDAAELLDYYFFVIETMFAIGYGSPRAPTCRTSSLFVTPTAVSGILINSVVLGVVFQKFSAASKRKWALAFSNCLVGRPSFPAPARLGVDSSASLEKGAQLASAELVYGCCSSLPFVRKPGGEAERERGNGIPGSMRPHDSAAKRDVTEATEMTTPRAAGPAPRRARHEREGPKLQLDAVSPSASSRGSPAAGRGAQGRDGRSEAGGNGAVPASSSQRARRPRSDEPRTERSDASDAQSGEEPAALGNGTGVCGHRGTLESQQSHANAEEAESSMLSDKPQQDTWAETDRDGGLSACGWGRERPQPRPSQRCASLGDAGSKRGDADGAAEASEDRWTPCARAREDATCAPVLAAHSSFAHLRDSGAANTPQCLCRAPTSPSTWQHYRLSFRVINVTHHSFFNPKLCLYLLKHSARGLRIRQFPTFRTDTPLEFLEMPITVTVDTRDRDSPLRDVTAEELKQEGSAYEILSFLSFTDNHTSRPVEIRKSWSLRSIKWGESFTPIVRPPCASAVSSG
ncbi:conserved hypothetical protein [Neospora caninum Liverpool]|nr:conserved hypothetical protein [Neospora caninum Liverpool]CBZ51725.1 conserved hypothetical protein [Neospora caninum Liverpool]|eukprot:XP_003881758.1 conserved hypothetical protein [Neospora caninum Liverpool]